ncbi:MAG: DeoR/GlpR family DNA-binding transcription regulator [Cypionkella sp.]|uniref:DeoR/GlpR family DNA-binding transcription regulator n=1 Tax=Cypionkella sp. TaxID=2811411 RepID=UPI002AB9CFB8|nr:DeoR/GlpR family DNA-binding transcription regulator [Cypionkella sp.]MDZ4310875.1 DeoR/GlpR family DNA-binding transcription regulator [Cypionkella sp.]MDZ4392133.1 DeoR/GlpR family DNA-binding transcription regulator [Cypionkella sp.]
MTAKDRRVMALSLALAERKVIHLKEAAALMQVSEMTVRRDVAENPDLFGTLGAHIISAGRSELEAPYAVTRAAESHSAAKRQASIHALRYLQPDETVFMDCGSTLIHLVDLIPADTRLTVVCYAFNTAERLIAKENITLILLGGVYHPASASFAGASGADTLNALGINVAFLSASGIDQQRGVSCEQFHEVPIKRKAMQMAQRRYLVGDSTKIGRVRPAQFADVGDFDAIITEAGEMPLSAKA